MAPVAAGSGHRRDLPARPDPCTIRCRAPRAARRHALAARGLPARWTTSRARRRACPGRWRLSRSRRSRRSPSSGLRGSSIVPAGPWPVARFRRSSSAARSSRGSATTRSRSGSPGSTRRARRCCSRAASTTKTSSSSKADWEVVCSAPGAATLLQVGKAGRILDVDPRTGGFGAAPRRFDRRLGVLARGLVGGPDPRPVTDKVKDAAWLPGGELVILRADGQGNTIEYPIGHTLVKQHGGELAALRASRDGTKLGVIEHATFDDTRGRVVIYRLDGIELRALRRLSRRRGHRVGAHRRALLLDRRHRSARSRRPARSTS